MVTPYYQDDLVTLYHGDCREHTAWLDADVLVTDPPYGVAHVSGWDKEKRAIAGDRDTGIRDTALTLWGTTKPAAVFGSWKCTRPAGTRNLVVWDKSDGVGSGMGDLAAAFGVSHEEMYVIGRWLRGDRKRLPSVLRTGDGLAALSKKVGHPTPKPIGLMETVIAAAPPGSSRTLSRGRARPSSLPPCSGATRSVSSSKSPTARSSPAV